MSSNTKVPDQNEEGDDSEAADGNNNTAESNEDDDRSAWAWLKLVLEVAVLVAKLIRAL